MSWRNLISLERSRLPRTHAIPRAAQDLRSCLGTRPWQPLHSFARHLHQKNPRLNLSETRHSQSPEISWGKLGSYSTNFSYGAVIASSDSIRPRRFVNVVNVDAHEWLIMKLSPEEGGGCESTFFSRKSHLLPVNNRITYRNSNIILDKNIKWALSWGSGNVYAIHARQVFSCQQK